MCGRQACTLDPDGICKLCTYNDRKGKRQKPVWKDSPGGQQYYPSYNISPGAFTPVMLSSQHFPSDLDEVTERVIQPMQWGLVPSWHKDNPKKVAYETNNCRAETMLTKRIYKVPLTKGRRCVVLADGFYEWKKTGEGKKQPYFIYLPDASVANVDDVKKVKIEKSDEVLTKSEPESLLDDALKAETKEYIGKMLLTIAGVFDVWKPPDSGSPLYTYSMITVDASSAMSSIHDRMPAILTSEQEVEEWLNFGHVSLSKASKLIRPVECIQCHPVSSVVNNSRINVPECIKPIDLDKPKGTSASSKMMMNWLGKSEKEDSEIETKPQLKKQKTSK